MEPTETGLVAELRSLARANKTAVFFTASDAFNMAARIVEPHEVRWRQDAADKTEAQANSAYEA